MSDSPSLLLSPYPSPTTETPAISPPPSPITGTYQSSPPISPRPSPQTGTNQLSPQPQTGINQIIPPPSGGNQLNPPPSSANQLSPPPPAANQLNPPPSSANQLSPPPPAATQVTPLPPELSQFPPPSSSANQITPAPPIANQLSPPPLGSSNQLISPPNAALFTPPPPIASQLTPPPPIASQLTPPPPVASESFPPPTDADKLDPEFIEIRKTPNPLLSRSIGKVNKSSPPISPPPITVPVPVLSPPPPPAKPVLSAPVQTQPPPSPSVTSLQPRSPSVPPPLPPVDALLTLAPPGVSVPVQLQPPTSPPLSLSPPGFPNQIISPLTNPTDSASAPAVHVNSPPTQDSSTGGPKHDSSQSTQATVGVVLLAAFIPFFLMCIFVVLMRSLRRNRVIKFPKWYKSKTNNSGLVSPTFSDLNSNGGFSYEQLYDMTVGFSDANLIGEGGFAHVYKGQLPNGTEVAVKQIKQEKAAEQELLSEMEIIGRIHHRHLVKFLGYCLTEQHQLLVYEFVPNQTLSYHLHEEGLPVLDWQKRIKIAIGSARGLKYLHEDCEPKIVHRDIKSANILLDNCFEPKLADFGLAKLRHDCNTHISTRVMGTYGYLAPEYGITGKLTYKSDVFSFGVVLLELITGRKAINPSDPEESLVEWAWPLLVEAINNGNLEILVDPKLEGNYVEKEMCQMVNVAASCVRHSAANRPSMPQVLKALESGCSPSDLSNGVWFGDSTTFDSRQYSMEIENFQKREYGSAAVSITSS